MSDDGDCDDYGTEPREMTMEEVREAFLGHVRVMVDYWTNLPDQTVEQRVSGVAFSVLVALDGAAASLPGFIVAPLPHPEDREFLQGECENWWPENHDVTVRADISGELHDEFYRPEREAREREAQARSAT